MGLGNNRDYTTADRNIRRTMAVLKARAIELEVSGVEKVAAVCQASHELQEGKLNTQVKAWVDPILTHKRAMRAARKAAQEEGE